MTESLTALQETLVRKKPKALTAEFWRFAFTALVCIYHGEFYFGDPKLLPSGESAVEFFFILSGFLLMLSVSRGLAGRDERPTPEQARKKALEYVKKKVLPIYPVLLIALILHYFVYPFTVSRYMYGGWGIRPTFLGQLKAFMNSEWEFLFLVGTPFGYNETSTPIVPMWFLTGLLIAGYIYTYLAYRHFDLMKFLAPLLGVLGLTYFTLNSTFILDFYIKMGPFPAGVVRALTSMAFGMTVFLIYDRVKDIRLSKAWIVLLSALELYAIYRFFALTIHQDISVDNFRRTVYVMIIVLMAFWNVTLFARLLNRRIWDNLGKITLTMYLTHFGLVPVYLRLVDIIKSKLGIRAYFSPPAKKMLEFFGDMGNIDRQFRLKPMSVKDIIFYLLLVVAAATLIQLFIYAVGRFICRPLKDSFARRRAEKEAAQVDAPTEESLL